jgi:DMSO reductase anchor subunit
MAQGLVVALAVAALAGALPAGGFVDRAFAAALALLLAGLGASFLHLGHPERAWRTVLMWRTSWMSREVIVLPVFIALVAAWWFALRQGATSLLLPLLAILGALALWYCTAMIYACLRFVQEWAHPLTVVNYTLIGLSSGLVLAGALAALQHEAEFLKSVEPCALVVTLAAGAARFIALRRNARLKPKSTLQSATGIRAARLVQTSMGMTGGSFNTREFFHGATLAAMKRARLGLLVGGFALPTLLLALAIAASSEAAAVLALVVQAPGLLIERWFFFAQARHPQNLYYQVAS